MNAMTLGLPELGLTPLIIPHGLELIILLAVVALILFLGPTKLPELARGIGKALGEFRRGKAEVERQLQKELQETSETAYRGGAAQTVVEINPRVTEAAQELGIEVGGRKERMVKMDILQALQSASDDTLRSVARILGVSGKNLDAEQLKDRIGEALGI